MQLTMCSASSPLRSISSRMSSSVADRIASASLASTVMAPRSARSFMRRSIVAAASSPPAPRRSPCTMGIEGGASPPPFRPPASLSGLPQSLHLRLRPPAALARLEAAEAERAEGHALQLDDPVADRLQHPAHLALAALADRELDDAGRGLAHLRRRGAPVLEPHALPQRL